MSTPRCRCHHSLVLEFSHWDRNPLPSNFIIRYLRASPLLGPSKQVTTKSVAKNDSAQARKVLILVTELVICWASLVSCF